MLTVSKNVEDIPYHILTVLYSLQNFELIDKFFSTWIEKKSTEEFNDSM